MARLKDPATCSKMKKEMLLNVNANGGWETMMIANAQEDQNRPYVGRCMDEIGRSVGKDPYEVAGDLILSEGGVFIVGFGMRYADTDRR